MECDNIIEIKSEKYYAFVLSKIHRLSRNKYK